MIDCNGVDQYPTTQKLPKNPYKSSVLVDRYLFDCCLTGGACLKPSNSKKCFSFNKLWVVDLFNCCLTTRQQRQNTHSHSDIEAIVYEIEEAEIEA